MIGGWWLVVWNSKEVLAIARTLRGCRSVNLKSVFIEESVSANEPVFIESHDVVAVSKFCNVDIKMT